MNHNNTSAECVLPTEEEIAEAIRPPQPVINSKCCFRCEKEGKYWVMLNERPVRVCEQHQYLDD